MSLGTLTLRDSTVIGNPSRKVRVYDVVPTGGADYTAGGETITPSAVGLRRITAAICDGPASTSNGGTAYTVKPLYQTDGSVKLAAHRTAASVNNPLLRGCGGTRTSRRTRSGSRSWGT
jgi:hypothetical protein